MKIDLSKHEIELIEKALDAYESAAGSNALMGNMIGMVLCPPEMRDKMKAEGDKEMNKAQAETKHRRMQCTMLKAKLYQTANVASEYCEEQEGITQ